MTVTEVTVPSAALRRLAKLYGEEPSYTDAAGQRQATSAESVVGALLALGADAEGDSNLADALRNSQRELLSRLLEPVAVGWDGTAPVIEVRLPAGATGTIEAALTLDTGEARRWTAVIESLRGDGARSHPARREFISGTLRMKVSRLPQGHHRLTVRVGWESV